MPLPPGDQVPSLDRGRSSSNQSRVNRFHMRISVRTLVLLLSLAIVCLLSTGGSAKLTQDPPIDRSKTTDAPQARPQKRDLAAELQRALTAPEVVSVIVELESDPVVVHQMKSQTGQSAVQS